MDLIKSRSLIFLSPSPLDTAALFSFCLNTIHSLQQIKLKKPGNKVWKRVNKILCLVKKKKKKKDLKKKKLAWTFETEKIKET